MEVLKQLVGVKREEIEYDKCKFYVYRKSKRENIFTTTLWRKSIGYVFNLSNSLVWWARKFPKLFPDWNIRVYFDSSVFKGVHGDPTDWIGLFNHVLTFPNDNIELWFYQCEFPHENTFGSMVRFHAFDDPTTKVVVSHNLEFLTSPKDRERINEWLKSGKKYHMYTSINKGSFIYSCVSYPDICMANNLFRIPSLMATFGIAKRDGNDTDIFRYGLQLVKEKNRKLKDFPYGVDEIILTTKLRDDINESNTFVSNIVLEYDYIPSRIYKCMLKIALNFGMFTNEILDLFGNSNYGKSAALSYILTNDIDTAVEYIKRGKEWIETECRGKNFDLEQLFQLIEKKMQEYLIIAFTGNSVSIQDIYYKIENDLQGIQNTDVTLLLTYHMFKTNLFYCIDFPGSCIKKKNFGEESKQEDGEDGEDDDYEDDDYEDDFSKTIFSRSVKNVYLD